MLALAWHVRRDTRSILMLCKTLCSQLETGADLYLVV